MANLSGLNRIMKLQKLLLPLNAHSSFLACSSFATLLPNSLLTERSLVIVIQNTDTRLHRIKRNYTSEKPLNTNSFATVAPAAAASTSAPDSTTYTSTSTTSGTINDFRLREEKREEEFARKSGNEEQKEKTNDEEEARRMKIEEIRKRILDAALKHVPQLGWTRQAIVRGAEDINYPSVVHGMFPEEGFALVSHFNGKCNDELIKTLHADIQNAEKDVTDPLNFLVRAVRMRLEMVVPYKAQWPQALGLIALPQNASTALAQLLTLVDDICYISGDRSVDINWYTRRIGLATIIKMTELYMLQDSSPDHNKTWEFLSNRMSEAIQLQSMLSQTDGVTNRFQRSFSSAFVTARNILGLNHNRP